MFWILVIEGHDNINVLAGDEGPITFLQGLQAYKPGQFIAFFEDDVFNAAVRVGAIKEVIATNDAEFQSKTTYKFP
jgi:hypothetical protein